MSSVRIIKQKGLSVYLKEIDENQLNDYLNYLTNAEKLRLETIKHPKKRCEFLASRALRTELFGLKEVHYTAVGAPFIENEGFVSFSHTADLVGIAKSEEFRVGMDLEFIKNKAVTVSYRFLHDSERLLFDPQSAHAMSLLWSFKETLFKLAGRKGVLWATDLIVSKQGDSYLGTILHADHKRQYRLAVTGFQHYLVTCNTTDATEIH